MTHPENSTPANPAQVTDAVKQAIAEAMMWMPSEDGPTYKEVSGRVYAALTAAIGAGGQAVEAQKPVATEPFVRRLIRVFNEHPTDDTSAVVLIDYAKACSAIAHPVQPGWRLVPEEPTEAMIEAHFAAHANAKTVFAEVPEIWRAMISAAPQPKGE